MQNAVLANVMRFWNTAGNTHPSYRLSFSNPQWSGTFSVTVHSQKQFHLFMANLTHGEPYLYCIVHLMDKLEQTGLEDNVVAQSARMKCWQLSSCKPLICLCVIGYIPYWHFYNICHIIFKWHVYNLFCHFLRWWGWLRFNICKCDTTGYFLIRDHSL